MRKYRPSDYMYYGFVFKALELRTPALRQYFKGVYINPFLHHAITRARIKLGLPVFK